jgi:hypothetical protein
VDDDPSDLTDAWQRFCGRLGAVGERLAAEPFRQSDADQALCVRHLTRQVVMALQGELEHSDPTHPTFHRYEEPWVQWGGPNPDNVYTRAAIDPAATYRVSGNVTGVRAAIFSLVEGDMHLGQYGVFGERTLTEFEVAPDGSLELWIAPDRHDGNWIGSHPAASVFMIRQYLCDWERDRSASFVIDRIDTRGTPPEPLTSARLADALDRAATWTEESIEYWCAYVERARERLPRNSVTPPTTPKGGAPTIGYGAAWWELGRDDALLIVTDRPDADYWGWTVHHRFRLDSGDFANRQTSLNMAQAFVDDDGRVRLVLAHDDPGVPNWIDTEGQPEGMLVYRSIGTRSRPAPESRILPVGELRAHLPRAHPVVDGNERRAQLAARRAAVLARYL